MSEQPADPNGREPAISPIIRRLLSGTPSSLSALMAAIGVFIMYSALVFEKKNDLVIVIAALVSIYLFSISAKIYSSNLKTPDVIPPQDRDLLVSIIKESGKDGLETYIKLSSLYGFTGTITKLGLSGLPLLTVALTIFFTCLGAVLYYLEPEKSVTISGSMMDLAKLTLGAFIGSFVQRNASAVAAAATSLDQSAKSASSLADTAANLKDLLNKSPG